MKKLIAKIGIILCVSIIIEVCIINSQFMLLMFSNNKNVEVDYIIENSLQSDTIIENKIYNTTSNGTNRIQIKDIGYEIENVRIYYKQDYQELITYLPKAKMYGNETYYKEYTEKRVEANKSNTYFNIRTETNCNEILIDIDYQGQAPLEIEKIVLNSTDMPFNILRVIFIFFVLLIILILKDKKIQEITYNSNSKIQKRIYYGIVFVILILLMIFWKQMLFSEEDSIFTKQVEKEPLMLQTEAFFNKSISLLEEPSEELKNLENPYDITARGNKVIDYLWDTSYYKGNYFQYFSLLPTVLIMLPFKIITGYYITTKAVAILFLGILIWLIALFFKKMVERYINSISFFNLILGMLTVIFGSNILMMHRAMVYELTETLGIICLLVGILLLLSCKEKEKNKDIKLILAGIASGFMVMAKPTFITWYLLMFPLLYYAIKDFDKKEIIKKICIFAIPLIITGTIQMIYNQLRYESIFEFGARYQLTIHDMGSLTQISIPRLIKGFLKYILTFPIITLEEFPFIQMYDLKKVVSTSFNVVSFEMPVIGIAAMPIMWGICFRKKVLKKEEKKEKELNKAIWIILIITILLIIENIVFAGIVEKYALPFKLILVIVSIIILLKGLEKRKISNTLFLILCITTIIIMLPIGFNTPENWLQDNNNTWIVEMKNTFEFWN